MSGDIFRANRALREDERGRLIEKGYGEKEADASVDKMFSEAGKAFARGAAKGAANGAIMGGAPGALVGAAVGGISSYLKALITYDGPK